MKRTKKYWTGAVFQPGQFSNLGSCPTGAVVTLGQLSTWTVVLPGQLSNLDSCPTWAVVQPGQLLPGQLSAWTVVTRAVVVAPIFVYIICIARKSPLTTMAPYAKLYTSSISPAFYL